MNKIKYILMPWLLVVFLSACSDDDNSGKTVKSTTPSVTTTAPAEGNNPTDLMFDKLEVDFLNPWIIGDGELDNTSLTWNPVSDAQVHILTLAFNDGWSPVLTINHNYNKINFKYDASVSGYSYKTSTDIVDISSSYFKTNATFSISVKAQDDNNTELASSDTMTITLTKAYLSSAPSNVWADSLNNSVALEWSEVEGATSYIIKYGTSSTNLNQSINGISLNNLSQTISGLTNGTKYYFSVAAANENGEGKFSDVIDVTPSVSSSFDFSIDKVVFNQSVQVELENNLNDAPIIANKPGVLRVFLNSNNLSQAKKVEIKLGGYNGNTELTSVVKEVSLANSTYASFDSTNKPVYFYINTTEWMSTGTSFYIEIDPDNKISETDESNNRYPASGELSFGFEDVYKMKVKLIPIRTTEGTVSITDDFAEGLEKYLKAIYPIDDVEVSIGNEFNKGSVSIGSSTDVWVTILEDLIELKNTEVSSNSALKDVFYYGVFNATGSPSLAGLAYINNISNFNSSTWEPNLIGMGLVDGITTESFYQIAAHELGHNHGRKHISGSDETNAYCGTPDNSDSDYTYNANGDYGRIGKTGFNDRKFTLYQKELYHDIMSYCSRQWISDYTYKGVYDFESKLDTLYSRSLASGLIRAADNTSRLLGQMIVGRITTNISDDEKTFTMIKSYNLTRDSSIPTDNTQYYAEVTLVNNKILEIPFNVNQLDHSLIERFDFFVPSDKTINTIIIKDTFNNINIPFYSK